VSARWRWIIAGIAIVATGAALLLIFAPRAPEVRVVVVARADAIRALAVNGRIRPRMSVDVRTPVAGTLIELPHDVGDQVAAGALIARVDDGPQRAAIAGTEAAVAAQEAVVAQARRDYARYRALGQFVTRQRLEQARLAVEQGTRELQRLRASRTQSREVRDRTVIRAPFAGIILERPVDRGQTVGLDTILYRLADLAAPEIMAEVDEAYAAELRPGTEAFVELAGQGRRLRAEVVHIEPRVDEATGAREVRLRFIDPLPSAPAGQTVSVNLVIERRPGALSIPRGAILDPGGNPHVRLVGADGRVTERPIRFIDWPAAEVIVTQGLEPGMRLLADPNAAGPGDRVRTSN
jgi:HlyD family secretion protein